MMARHGTLAIAVGLLALATLAGCRDDEQDRPLTYEKGVYHGKPDAALPNETLDALRQRAMNQSYY